LIHHLDQTLERFLRRKVLPSELQDQVEVSFSPPDDQFQTSLGTNLTINFFLYDIAENLELRTQEWRYEQQTGESLSKIRMPPPTRVDCSYLITVWSSSAESRVSDEHQLLGLLMQGLCRYSYLPEDDLVGSLVLSDAASTNTQSESNFSHIPTRTLQAGKLQSVAEFWQAMGGKPKASINYTVTLSVATQEPSDPIRVVDEGKSEWNLYQK
jgi:hypothetical protein